MKDGTEDKLSVQMEAISNVFKSFKDIDPLRQTNKELLQEQYVVLVQWATSYFDVAVIAFMDLWPRLWELKQDEAPELWALIELCLCCSAYGNAVWESFISYLSVVQTDCRNRLNESNLIDLMRIKVRDPSLHVYRERFGELAVELWNSDKLWKKTQGKRKQYEPKGSASKRTREREKEEFQKGLVKRCWK